MSVSLTIEWPDGNDEDLHLGSHRQFRNGWVPTATELGLELIPRFSSWIKVTPANLDEILGELVVYRAELVRLGWGETEDVMVVDRLTAALTRLKSSEGWRATIG